MDDTLLINRYRIQERRGHGGFGAVDVAWDTRLHRRVAIKRIPFGAHGSDIPGIDEARTAALLSDAHIVSVHDFEVTADEALIIMENIDGPSLDELMRGSSALFDTDVACALLAPVAAALECAHENQVLHLDIKPANILIDHSGRVKVSDFGLSELSGSLGYQEAAGGTIGYMPPEQIELGQVDERSDLWAFAALAYHLLTGANPFMADTAQESLRLICERQPVPPSELRDALDPALDAILLDALAADPDLRPGSVALFWAGLSLGLGRERAGRQRLRNLVAVWAGGEDGALGGAGGIPDGADAVLGRAGGAADGVAAGAADGVTAGAAAGAAAGAGGVPDGRGGVWEDADGIPEDQGAYALASADALASAEGAGPAATDWADGRIVAFAKGAAPRLLAALGCGMSAWLGASGLAAGIPQFDVTLGAITAAVIAVAGMLAPTLGVALACVAVGAGLVAAGYAMAGFLLPLALLAWWTLCGRRSRADAVILSLALPAAWLGIPFVIPLLTGYFLSMRRAAGLALASGLAMMQLSAVTVLPLFAFKNPFPCGLSIVAPSDPGLAAGLLEAFWRMDTLPVLLSWLLAALLMSLVCRHGSRVSCCIAAILSVSVLAVCIPLGTELVGMLPIGAHEPTDLAAELWLSLTDVGSVINVVGSLLVLMAVMLAGVLHHGRRTLEEEPEWE
jgi:hypothetical protein